MPRPLPTPSAVVARRLERDERGVVLIMAAVGLLLALVASALAVDLGRQASEKKEDQLIADLAALDAVRELRPLVVNTPGVSLSTVLADVTSAARASAQRNGFDPAAAGHALTAEAGSVDSQNTFTPGGATPNAVRVLVGSNMDYVFAPGGKDLTAKAIAKLASTSGPGGVCCGGNDDQKAGFFLGSALASANFDSATAPVVNRVFGQMIGGNADIVSWNGLGNANITMSALQHELGNLGLDVGTPQKLLAADLTLNRLFTATANALDQQGDSRAAIFRNGAGIIAQSTNTTTFKLANIMTFDQGAGTTVADANLKVRNLVVAAAEAANGSNVISVPNAGLTVPGVSNTAVTLQVVEPMKWVYGPVTTTGSTAQIKLTVTNTIDQAFTFAGLVGSKIVGTLPFTLDAAGATGTIAAIDCSATSPGMTVGVDTKPVTGAGSATMQVLATVPLLGQKQLLNVPTVATMPTLGASHGDLPFAYSSEFHPTWDGSKRVGTYPMALDTKTLFSTTGAQVLFLPVGVSAGPVANAALATLAPLLGRVETKVIDPLIKSLGLTVGVADVMATDHLCIPGANPTTTPGGPTLDYIPTLVG
ncbi:MAG: hypothetical protein QOE35_3520 [Actinomycetota bacterium]|jgi:uncharacterized membrane protein